MRPHRRNYFFLFRFAYIEIGMDFPCSKIFIYSTHYFSLKLFKHLKIIKFDDTTSVKLIFLCGKLYTRFFDILWLILRLSAFFYFCTFVSIFESISRLYHCYKMWINQHHTLIENVYTATWYIILYDDGL